MHQKKQKQEEKQKIKENDHVNLLSKAYPYLKKKIEMVKQLKNESDLFPFNYSVSDSQGIWTDERARIFCSRQPAL